MSVCAPHAHPQSHSQTQPSRCSLCACLVPCWCLDPQLCRHLMQEDLHLSPARPRNSNQNEKVSECTRAHVAPSHTLSQTHTTISLQSLISPQTVTAASEFDVAILCRSSVTLACCCCCCFCSARIRQCSKVRHIFLISPPPHPQ